MKLPAVIKFEVTRLKEVVELQAKYDELIRGMGDLIIMLSHPEEDHISIRNKDEFINSIMKQVSELLKENKELKKLR
jgi:hypothetical protein